MARKVTKPGKYGTLTLYRITYEEAAHDPGSERDTVRLWGYDIEHALDRFYEGDEGYHVVSVAEVRR